MRSAVFGAGAQPLDGTGFEVHHSGDRIRTPDDRVAAAQQFDPADFLGHQVAEIEPAPRRARIVDLDPVDQHEQLLGPRPAHANSGEPAECAVTSEGHARQPLQDSRKIGPLERAQFGVGHYAHRIGYIHCGRGQAGRDDGDRRRLVRNSRNPGLRHGRRGKDADKNKEV